MNKIIFVSLATSVLLFGAEETTKKELKTHTELSYTNTSGNTDTTALALDAKGEKQWDTFGIRLAAFAYYSEDNGVESKNQWGLELNYDRPLSDRLSLNYLVTYKEDQFSGFDYQLTTGPGLLHKTINTEEHKLTTQANVLYAADKIEATGEVEEYTSLKAGILYEWQILDNLKFIEEATIRTEASDTNNYFAYSKTAIQNKINSMFSMGLSYKIDYVNEPADGKTTTDRTFLASLIIDY